MKNKSQSLYALLVVLLQFPLCSLIAQDKTPIESTKIITAEATAKSAQLDAKESIQNKEAKKEERKDKVADAVAQEAGKEQPMGLEKHPEEHEREGYEAAFYEEKPVFIWAGGLGRLEIGFKNKIEFMEGRSLNLLSRSKFDQTMWIQNTSDMTFFVKQGDAIRSRMVIRNKYRAGDVETLGRTSESTVKIGDVVDGAHTHFLGKQIFWIREAWFEMRLNDVMNLKMSTDHFFKIGIFPFELGRGISLGDAFAVQPGILGFYSNNAIDQFAFGGLLHGEITPDNAMYDVYFSISHNRSDTFANVNDKTYINEIGRRDDPRRGFGIINIQFASRFTFLIEKPLCSPGNLRLEPYIFIDHEPEQRVEFPADASSKLATPGLSVEYEDGEIFDWGFEMAANFGHQHVRGWDRNQVKFENRDGAQVIVYSKVTDGVPGAPGTKQALVTPANKAVVNNSMQGAAFNDEQIDSSGLYNDPMRFRDAYNNYYKGAMFVADIGMKIKKNVKLTAMYGVATGDENPNRDLDDPNDAEVDGNYLGFIPIQSIYSGKRVLSVFFLGSGKIARPLSVPPARQSRDRFASTDSGFTNLILAGFGADIKPKINCFPPVRFRPNIIFGWQQFPTRKFDLMTKLSSKEAAEPYLGVEFNIFAEAQLLKQLRGFLVTGFFLPGDHFFDTRGKPLNADQVEALNNPGCDGLFGYNSVPLLDTHTGFLFNIGMEYAF